jgi:hypothetical protein
VKDEPRLALVVEPIPNQPWFIRQAIARAARLFHDPRRFPELTGHALAGPSTRIRQRRSSRREAWALLAMSVMRHVDRRTFRIGDQRADGLCNGVAIKRYREETGLSRWRISATLREWEAAAYMVTHAQPVEALKDADGRPLLDANGRPRHRGFPAQRQLTPLFFQRLGFTPEKVKTARARGYAEWTKRRAPAVSAVAILGGRRELRKLHRANQARTDRLEAGHAPAAAPAAPRPAPTPERLDRANAERLSRLQSLPPPETGPSAKPPSSR